AHRCQPEEPDCIERDGPRHEERELQIEKDEEDRDEVVAHIEAIARIVERLEPALVGRKLLRVLAAATQREADAEQDSAQDAGHDQEDQDRQVVCKHSSLQHPGYGIRAAASGRCPTVTKKSA